MDQATQVLLGTVFGFGGVAVLIAIRLLPRPRPQLAAPPATDTAVRRPCHTTACGHMTTPHDRTPTGALVCRGCGTVTAPEVPRA